MLDLLLLSLYYFRIYYFQNEKVDETVAGHYMCILMHVAALYRCIDECLIIIFNCIDACLIIILEYQSCLIIILEYQYMGASGHILSHYCFVP